MQTHHPIRIKKQTTNHMEAVFPHRSNISAYNLLTNHQSLPDDGRSISQSVANINILVQDKTKLFFQNILQHETY